MKKKLTRSFYTRPTLVVAKDLLGKYLVRKIGKTKIQGKIIEVEAYLGPRDKASHAYQGKKTLRNQVEFLEGGYLYIYLVYGLYWQLNIVTAHKNQPECVLIRAVEPVSNKAKAKGFSAQVFAKQKFGLINGPGKVCQYFKLDKSFYGEDLTKSKRIWFILLVMAE